MRTWPAGPHMGGPDLSLSFNGHGGPPLGAPSYARRLRMPQPAGPLRRGPGLKNDRFSWDGVPRGGPGLGQSRAPGLLVLAQSPRSLRGGQPLTRAELHTCTWLTTAAGTSLRSDPRSPFCFLKGQERVQDKCSLTKSMESACVVDASLLPARAGVATAASSRSRR